jgi:NitT/TauT family transport system permease protein
VGRYIALGAVVALGLTYSYAFLFQGYAETRMLPLYTLYTFARIALVFVFSLLFGLGVGVLAATNRLAGRVIVPIFDILQSVPILGYFPILLVALILAFPGMVGEELGVLVLLFTAMEWSIFFGVVGAVKAIPRSVEEAASSFGMRGMPYFRHVILPAVVPALISASTLAWNDGWTFDIASEYVTYGSQAYAVSGLGSFIYRASYVNVNVAAAWLGLIVIGEVVIITNQLIWHRLADNLAKRRTVFGFHPPERLVHPLRVVSVPARRILGLRFRVETLNRARFRYSFSTKVIAISFITILAIIGVLLSIPNLVPGLGFVSEALQGQNLAVVPVYTLFTLGRLALVYCFVLLVSIAAAVLAVRKKNFTKYFYPVYDTGRAIPYLALFPPLFATLVQVMPGEVGLELSSFFLLFMGMVWYIIFNVVTAATFLPVELREVSALFGFRGWTMVRNILIPAILPAIITGSILAWGGGWNVVIYSEYVTQNGQTYSLPGLGSLLDQAANAGNSVLVIFYLFIMSGIVILLGRLVWRRLLNRVEKRGMELS